MRQVAVGRHLVAYLVEAPRRQVRRIWDLRITRSSDELICLDSCRGCAAVMCGPAESPVGRPGWRLRIAEWRTAVRGNRWALDAGLELGG